MKTLLLLTAGLSLAGGRPMAFRVAALLLVGRVVAGWYVDYLWYDALGAHELWYARTIDLLILDWKMPEIDRIETARQIRKRIGKEITIIVLTSYEFSEIEEEAKAAKAAASAPDMRERRPPALSTASAVGRAVKKTTFGEVAKGRSSGA